MSRRRDDDEFDSEDSLTYSNGVIEKIVAIATREADHVLGMKGNLMHFVQETLGAENLTKGVSVEVTDDNRVIVNISVIIEYGAYAPAIFEDVKERVTDRLEAMTGLEVAGINLRIEDVMTPRGVRRESQARPGRGYRVGAATHPHDGAAFAIVRGAAPVLSAECAAAPWGERALPLASAKAPCYP